MTSDTTLIDIQLERIAEHIGEKAAWDWLDDKGAAYYNALPREVRLAVGHLCRAARHSGTWPDSRLIAAAAEHFGARTTTVLAAFGWTPPPGRQLAPEESSALNLSAQLLLGVSWDGEIGGQ